MKATALLTNWKRNLNLPIIIESIRRQSVEVEVFLWDNSGEGNFESLVDLQISASRNLKCFPRWSMSQFASSDYVFTLDDDLALRDPTLIEQSIEYVGQSQKAIGKEGVTLIPGEGYFGSIHVAANRSAVSAVDILKGRFIFARKELIVNSLSGVSATVSKPRIEDDIFISSKIGRKEIPPFVAGALKEMPDHGLGEWRSPDHRQSREDALALHFPFS
jgi:hypothetical protein